MSGDRPIPDGVKEGGNFSGDFHCWIENMDGKVVFDPVFRHYKEICKMRGLDIKKPHRFAWNNQDKWCRYFTMSQDIKECKTEPVRSAIRHIPPQPLCCRGNSINYFVSHLRADDSKYIIRIGSMGWESKRDPNKIWWEYG